MNNCFSGSEEATENYFIYHKLTIGSGFGGNATKKWARVGCLILQNMRAIKTNASGSLHMNK